jgi:hypothetical protein
MSVDSTVATRAEMQRAKRDFVRADRIGSFRFKSGTGRQAELLAWSRSGWTTDRRAGSKRAAVERQTVHTIGGRDAEC